MDEQLKQYEELKSELKKALNDKKKHEDEYDKLTQEIYDKETEYFSNINSNKHPHGNIIKGFDGFSKAHHSHSSHGDNNAHLMNHDRIFSLTSVNFGKQIRPESNDQD